MRQYLDNLVAWWRGFGRLDKPGWDAGNFRWLYATDYLACCLFMAGPVTSISRYTEDHWFNSYHGAHTGPDLWGTSRCVPWVRVAVPVGWLLLLVVVL